MVVPEENLVGPLNGGWQVMLSGIELERTIMSGGYVGVAQSTLDDARRVLAPSASSSGDPWGRSRRCPTSWPISRPRSTPSRLLAYRAAWLLANGRPAPAKAPWPS